MHVQIRDAKSSETLTIEESSVLGREGGQNDIPVADPAVSGRHARIYPDGAKWFLEDLGSSNGTFVKGAKISTPVELSVGMRFSLCQHVFNVTELEAGDQAPTSLFTKEAGGLPTGPTSGEVEGPEVTEIGEDERRSVPAISRAPGSPTKMPRAPSGASEADRSRSSGRRPTAADDQPLVPYLLATVPLAFRYYLAAVPSMVVNPIASVRRSLTEMRWGAFGNKELISYAIPPMVFLVLIASIGSVVSAIVNRAFSASVVLTPIIALVVACAIAVLTGYIFQPIMKWLVSVLSGKSDDVSRSNYFVALMTAFPLQALAAGLGAVILLIPLPFIGVVTPLLSLYAALVVLFVTYSWFKYFQVASWVSIVLIVLMGLSGVWSAWAMRPVVRAGVDRLRGGPATVAQADEAGLTDPKKEAEIAALRARGELTPEIERVLRATNRPEVVEVVSASDSPGAEDDADETDDADDTGEGADVDDGAAPAGSSVVARAPASGSGRSDYPRFITRRGEIEAAIERDPTNLTKDGILARYKEMLTLIEKTKDKYKSPKPPKRATPEQIADARIQAKLRDAEIYRLTVQLVDEMYERLF